MSSATISLESVTTDSLCVTLTENPAELINQVRKSQILTDYYKNEKSPSLIKGRI